MPKSAAQAAKTRKLPKPNYKSFRLHKRIKHPKPDLPSGFKLLRSGFQNLWRQKRLFSGIFLVYLLLSMVLVKSNAEPATNAEFEVIRIYQTILLVIISLAIIWALRRTKLEANKTLVRESFYKSMYPLIPFQLVLIVILLQMIPAAIASYLYQQVFNSDLVVTSAEQVLWAILVGMLCLLSLYMIASSVFALYIVTLPDTWPMTALRSARELVRHRRWLVVRKLVFLLVSGSFLAACVLIPLVWVLPGVLTWANFLLGLSAVFVVHSYIYQLYRELLA